MKTTVRNKQLNVALWAAMCATTCAVVAQPATQPVPPGAWGTPAPGAQQGQPSTQTQQGAGVQAGQGAQAGVKRLPIPIAPPTVREVVRGAVDDAADTVLTPGDVGKLKDAVMKSRQRQSVPTYPGNRMPKPVSRSVTVEADPSQQPQLIRLSQATITSFVFSDMAGNPWVIESRSFDPSMFTDGQTGCGTQSGADRQAQKPTNVLNIQPCDPYAYGNVVLTIKGFPSPVVFMLATGQANEVDVRVSARVRGTNPDAKAEIVVAETTPDHDPVMQDFLDGTAPNGAVPLKITAGMGQAWLYAGSMYFRTRNQVYAPAFHSHVGSTDGVHVYKFRRPEPYLTVSSNGRADTVVVTGY